MIQVCSDSTADLSRELAERYHIHIIPLHVVLGDQEYRDSVDITPQEIFRWSDTHQSTPKTSAPGFYETLDFFKKILDAGDEIIAMSISSEISTSYNVMCLAAKELKAEDRISVIDSRNLSTGIAHLLLSACDLANAGWAREDIVREVRRMIPRVRTSFVVNTLVYLARGGRCNAVTAMLGGMLQLHPRINVTDGVMTTGRSYRGRTTRMIDEYVRDLMPALENAVPSRVFVNSAACDEEIVRAVREKIEGMHRFREVLVTTAGGVICSHCGPGTFSITYVAPEN